MHVTAFLAALVVSGASAVPTGSRDFTCSTTCDHELEGGYQPNTLYEFRYTADVETAVVGSSDEASRLHATSLVQLTALSRCDLQLKLVDVSLQDSQPKDETARQDVQDMAVFKTELERGAITFSMKNGRVEQICSDKDEPVWVTNFKRGIISSFVNSATNSDRQSFSVEETDVSGVCDAEYSVQGSEDSLRVTKSKNLLSCRHRGHLISSLQSTPYHSSSKIQSLPILQDSLECQQSVSYGRVVKSHCRERQLFRPMSQGDGGAVTVTTTHLTQLRIIEDVSSPPQGGARKKTSLLFDHADPEVQQTNNYDVVLSLLEQLDESTAEEVRPEAPRLFHRLVVSMRALDYDSLQQVVGVVPTERHRKYLMDALPLIGTAASLSVMTELSLAGGLSPEENKRWVTSLAFVHEPSLEMVNALLPLLENSDVSKQSMLGVSSLVHNYCQYHPQCTSDEPVRRSILSIEALLPEKCHSRSENQVEQTLLALKAIGNIGHVVSAVDKLQSCIESTENRVEVRTAAVNAFHKVACSEERQHILMNSFSNAYDNTEVRIASYMTLMKCPSHNNIKNIHDVLSREPVNHVSSFVWTHLSNIKESSDPTKQHIKLLLSDISLREKFKTDFRKFSRYVEKSYFSESMNTGASVEGSVVFSPDSFVPRSAMMNLTVDLFGEAVNLFEVGGRVEGFDNFAENIFGRSGYASQKAIGGLLSMFNNEQANNEIISDTPKGSAYLKIFGNELSFNQFDNLQDVGNMLRMKTPMDFLSLLLQETEYTDNMNFLDSTYIIPTVAGLPFSLRAVGSTTFSLKTGGNLNMDSWGEWNFEIEGFVRPSASISVTGEMGVDAYVARTGVKLNANLHTSTVVDGSVRINGGELVSVNINMPKDRVELIDVSTKFYRVQHNHEVPMQMHNLGVAVSTVCTGEFVDRILGVKVCANSAYPMVSLSNTVLDGAIVQIFVDKTDSIDGFTFRYARSSSERDFQTTLLIDAPGGSQDRKIHANLMYDNDNKAIEASLVTPVGSVGTAGMLQLDGPTKQANFKIDVNKQELFSVETSFEHESGSLGWRVAPTFALRYGPGQAATLESSLYADYQENNYGGHVTLHSTAGHQFNIEGELQMREDSYSLSHAIGCSVLDLNQVAIVQLSPRGMVVDIKTDYSIYGSPTESVTLALQSRRHAQDDMYTQRVTLTSEFSAVPVLNTDLTYIHTSRPGHCDNRLSLSHNGKTYTLTGQFGRRPHGSVATQLQLTAAHLNVNVRLSGNIDLSTPHVMKFSAETRLTESLHASTRLIINSKHTSDGFHYGLAGKLVLPQGTYAVEVGVRHEQAAAHLKLFASRDVMGELEEVNLVALLALEEGGRSLEVTLFVPHVPRLQLLGRLMTGGDDGAHYDAMLGLTYGQTSYNLKAGYYAEDKHIVFLNAECPNKQLDLTASADISGLQHNYVVDLDYGRHLHATMTLNPYGATVAGNLNVFWNKDVDDSDSLSVDAQLKTASKQITATVTYPGHQHRISGSLKDSKLVVDLEYAPEQLYHVEMSAVSRRPMNVEFETKITTPHADCRQISLKFVNAPQSSNLRDENKLVDFQLIGQWNEEESKLSGHVISAADGRGVRSSDNSYSLQAVFDLASPLEGWQQAHFDTTVYVDGTTYSARAAGSLNELTAGLGVLHEFTMYDGRMKLSSGVDLRLPLDAFSGGQVNLDVSSSRDGIEAGAVAIWHSTSQVSELSVVLTSLSEGHLLSGTFNHDTTLVLRTPFAGHREYSARALVSQGSADIIWLLNVKRAGDDPLLITEFNMSYGNPVDYRMSARFQCASLTSVGFSAERKIQRNIEMVDVFAYKEQSNFTLNAKTTRNAEGRSLEVEMKLPCGRTYGFENVNAINLQDQKFTQKTVFRRDTDELELNLHGEIVLESEDPRTSERRMTVHAQGLLLTPFNGWRIVNVTQNINLIQKDRTEMHSVSIFTMNDKIITLEDDVEFSGLFDWSFVREVSSNTQFFQDCGVQGSFKATPNVINLILQTNVTGKTKRLYYSQVMDDTQDETSLAIEGHVKYNDFERRLKAEGKLQSDGFMPFSVSLACPYGETRVYGTLLTKLITGRSTITIESPFSNKIFISEYTSYEDSLDYSLNVRHGFDSYALTIKGPLTFRTQDSFDINFSSPEDFIGAGRISIDYNFDDVIKMASQLVINDWNASCTIDATSDQGTVQLKLPYEGYRSLRAVYQVQDESALLKLHKEQQQAKIFVSRSREADEDAFNVRVSTPFRGFESVRIVAIKDNTRHNYKMDYIRGRHAALSFAVLVHERDLTANAEIFSKLVEPTSFKFNINLDEMHLNMHASKSDKRVDLIAYLINSEYKKKVNVEYSDSLVFDSTKLSLAASHTYDATSAERHTLELSSRYQDKYFTSSVEVFSDESSRTRAAKLLLESNSINIDSHMNIVSDAGFRKFEAQLKTSLAGLENAKLEGEANWAAYPIKAHIKFAKNEQASDLAASMSFSEENIDIQLKTPCEHFNTLLLQVNQHSSGIDALIARNQDQIALQITRELSLMNSKVSVLLKTPYDVLRYIECEMYFDLRDANKVLAISMARNSDKFEVSFETEPGLVRSFTKLSLKTPVDGWNSFSVIAMHDLGQEEKMVEFSYEINGVRKTLAGRTMYGNEVAYFDLMTPFEGYERMGVSGKYVSKRGKRAVEYEANMNDKKHRLYILYERKGMESAKLLLQTPIEYLSNLMIEVASEQSGNTRTITINTDRDGNKNMAVIKLSGSDGAMDVSIEANTYYEGFENMKMTGSLNYGSKTKSFSLTSSKGEENMEISGELEADTTAGKGQLKAMLPIDGLNDAAFSFEYTLSDDSKIKLTAVQDGVTKELEGTLTRTANGGVVTLNTPFEGFSTISIEGSRSENADGKVEAKLTLKRGDREIELEYEYKNTPDSKEFEVEIESPYELLKEMRFQITYNRAENSQDLKVHAKRNDREWKLSMMRSREAGKEMGSASLSSPVEAIMSVQANYELDMSDTNAIKLTGSYQRNDQKYAVQGHGGLHEAGRKAEVELMLTTPLQYKELKASMNYDVTQPTKTVASSISADDNFAKMSAQLVDTKGEISIETSHPDWSKLQLMVDANVAHNFRDISAEVILSDGSKTTLDYDADYTKPNMGGGSIVIKCDTYGNHNLHWNYQVEGDDYEADLTLDSNMLKLDVEGSIQGEMFRSRTIELKSSIVSDMYTSTRSALIKYDLNKGLSLTADIDSNGQKINGMLDLDTQNNKRMMKLAYDGVFIKNLKLDGEWTTMDSLEGQKDFKFTMSRDGRQTTLNGFVKLSTSMKSGSMELVLKTPLSIIEILKCACKWNMIKPNQLLEIDYTRNTKHVYFLLSGTRETGKGDVSVQISLPHDEAIHGKNINEISCKMSFDITAGVSMKFDLTKPFNVNAELDYKRDGSARKIKALYDFKDSAEDIIPWSDQRHLEADITYTDREQGPKLQSMVKTSIEGFEEVELNVDVTRTPKKMVKIEYIRGSKTVNIKGEFEGSKTEGSGSFEVQAPVPGFEDISLDGNYAFGPGKKGHAKLNYNRNDKYLKLEGSGEMTTESSDNKITTFKLLTNLEVDTNIGREIKASMDMNLDTSQAPRFVSLELTGKVNNQMASLKHTMQSDEEVLDEKTEIVTPFKAPYKMFILTSTTNLREQKAKYSVKYGMKEIVCMIEWFTGANRQYGAELRLETPFSFKTMELEGKATLQDDGSVDLMGHYRRKQLMIHVTGTLRPYELDLNVESPMGKFQAVVGVTIPKTGATYIGRALITLESGTKIGGEVTVKAASSNDMELSLDVQTPLENWSRITFGVAFTNTDTDRLIRLQFEAPFIQRFTTELQFSNRGDDTSTDFSTGVKVNYAGYTFTCRTAMMRDAMGMKYELEIASPFKMIPNLRIASRR